MALRESNAAQEVEFEQDPKIVAEACQRAIELMNLKLLEVSPTTGVISAKSKTFNLTGDWKLMLNVSKNGDKTKVRMNATAAEGLATSGRAQQFLTEFIGYLSADQYIKGRGTSGW